jgi:hypothetical protein
MKPIIRCSQLDQLFECPGSFTLQQLVNPRDGDESHEGNYLHWAIASRLVGELGAWPPEGGLPPPRVPEGYKVPTRSDWIADYCFDLVKREALPNWSLEVEPELVYEFDRFILMGHLDVLAVAHDGTESAGYDWKTGYRAVDPADSNNQCLGYIVLQKRAYPALRRAQFTIAQPRANEDEGEQRVSTVVVEGDALNDAVAYLEQRVNAALDRLDEINTGPRQCRWCSAARPGGCPGWEAEIEAMKMKLTPQALAEITRDPTSRALADVVVSARIIKQGIADAEATLKERLEGGLAVTSSGGVNISVTEQNGQYSVTAPEALYTRLLETLPANEIAKVVDPSVTRLKDAIARVMNVPKTGKAPVTAESVFAERFRPHMEQGKRRIFKFS